MIKIEGLSYWYPEEKNPALKEVSASFDAGEVVLLTGSNGSGKSTLLKTLLAVTPHLLGSRTIGSVFINTKSVADLATYQLAGEVGIVLQDPETQISNLTVWDEVTFGPGNLRLDKAEIIKRSEKSLTMMNLMGLRNQSVFRLSGGQLQRLSIASLLAMSSEILILDEPTTNLDPHGVDSVVEAIKILRSHTKLMIISSHAFDPFLEVATRVMVMDEGSIVWDESIDKTKNRLDLLEDYGVRTPDLWKLERILQDQASDWQPGRWKMANYSPSSTLVSLERIGFGYNKKDPDVLEDINLVIDDHERLAFIGHNGQGKTTLARLIAGLIKPTRGKLVEKIPKSGMVLQRPTLGFLYNSVGEELKGNVDLMERLELSKYQDKSPFLLSGGEQRRLGLAIALSLDPELLILDESTAGLDAKQVGNFLAALNDFNRAIIHITHDPRIVGQNVDTVVAINNRRICFVGQPNSLSPEMLIRLGYDRINPTVQLLIKKQLDRGIALLPEQLEVESVGLQGREDVLS